MWSEFVFDVNEIELTSFETLLCQKILDKWVTDVNEGKKIVDGWKTDINLLTKDQRVYMVFLPEDWKKIKSTASSDINKAIALAISKVLYVGKSAKEKQRVCEQHNDETMDFDQFAMQETAAGRKLVHVYFIPGGLENAYDAIESIIIQELKTMPDFCPKLLNTESGNSKVVGKKIKNYDQTKRSEAVMYLFFLMLTKSNAYLY